MPTVQCMLQDNFKIIAFPKVDLIFINCPLSPKLQLNGMLEVRRSTALSSDRKITLQSDMHLSLGERYRNIIHTRLRYTELC